MEPKEFSVEALNKVRDRALELLGVSEVPIDADLVRAILEAAQEQLGLYSRYEEVPFPSTEASPVPQPVDEYTFYRTPNPEDPWTLPELQLDSLVEVVPTEEEE